jgi:hypothetical protein
MPPLLQNEYNFNDVNEMYENNSESDYDDDYINEILEILSEEDEEERKEGEIVIGTYWLSLNEVYGKERHIWLLHSSVSPENFMIYHIDDINMYLAPEYEMSELHKFNPGILKVKRVYDEGQENYYSSIIDKTYWLRIIQRTWKKIIKERKKIIKERCKMSSLETREITGKWPNGLNYLPGLYGCLKKLV